jgi:hypothetical protein
MTFKLRKRHNPLPPVPFIHPGKLEMLLHGTPDPDRRDKPPLSEGAIEAKRLLAVAQQAYVKQQENQMADMKTALSKVINEWDKDAPAPTEYKQDGRTTTGVSQATFEYVRRNPGKTKAVAIRDLELQGYKPTSTTTLLSAMVRQKQILVDTDGKLRTAADHYTPVKYVPSSKAAKPVKPVKPVKPAPKQVKEEAPQGLAALYVQPTAEPERAAVPKPTPTTAQQVLETLNVKEAYELFLALAKMFA